MASTTGTRTESYPGWVQGMREVFRAGTMSQFVIYGNVHDLVSHASEDGPKFYALKDYLAEVLFAKFDVVLYYSRGAGLKALRGQEAFFKFLKMMDDWTQSNYASSRLPRELGAAMELLDTFLRYSLQRTVIESGQAKRDPLRTCVIMDYVQFVVPETGGAPADKNTETLIRLLDWAADPNLLGAQVATVLITESLAGLSRTLVENPYNHKVKVSLPTEEECLEYLQYLATQYPEMTPSLEVPVEVMAKKVVGLTRVSLHHMVALAVKNGKKLTSDYLSKIKKELIEKECAGLLEFVESKLTLDNVSGCDGAKKWLREDARLLREGKFTAVPMGYLMTGRIGTGKTWLTNCWAGEVGVPFVVFKNFRDKWMGNTESNLEKIFTVLKALGQVVVFVDEADQMAGKRSSGDSDNGLSGRIYGMFAQEMSNTANRGRIVWVFATSRPDLLEVDLKRPGRLDVHIPLFPPQNDEERAALFESMARKIKLPLSREDLPTLPPGVDLGGNEMETVIVRAMRVYELQGDAPDKKPLKEILAQVVAEYRPLPHVKNLEYMDLIAVKECTDTVFLSDRYKSIPPEELDRRIAVLKMELNIQ